MANTSTQYALLELARDALAQNDGVTAARLTGIVLEQHPGHLEARHLAALAYYLQGFSHIIEPALPDFTLRLNPQSGTLHKQAGQALHDKQLADLARLAFRTAALLDYHMHPEQRGGFGGPFNGQVLRMAAFRALAAGGRLAEVIETGSHRGTTTEFLARFAGGPVKTTELSPYYHELTRLRFEDLVEAGCPWAKTVQLFALDSRDFLPRILSEAPPEPGVSFFYLDAHGDYVAGARTEFPIVAELTAIRAARADCIVMIDDFQVPDDPGYHAENAIALDLVAPLLPSFDAWFYPIGASHDCGMLRGCLVLSGSPETTRQLSTVGELRLAGPS